jgi:hypothetical protein
MLLKGKLKSNLDATRAQDPGNNDSNPSVFEIILFPKESFGYGKNSPFNLVRNAIFESSGDGLAFISAGLPVWSWRRNCTTLGVEVE